MSVNKLCPKASEKLKRAYFGRLGTLRNISIKINGNCFLLPFSAYKRFHWNVYFWIEGRPLYIQGSLLPVLKTEHVAGGIP